MNASKENAEKALNALGVLKNKDEPGSRAEAMDTIRDFIAAAHRKLPREASYAKEKSKKAG